MAISLGMTASTLLNKLDFSEAEIISALSVVQFQFFTNGVLLVPKSGESVGIKLNIEMSIMMSLKKGSLSEVTKTSLKEHMMDAIAKLKNQTKPLGAPGHSQAIGGAAAEETSTGLLAPAFTGMFSTGKMKTAPMVKLRDAQMMYQPVHGTSPGSRYYVIAIGKGLLLAAKWSAPNSLSIRVEGEGYNKFKSLLNNAGLSCKDDYASVHLHPDNATWAARCMGSIIAAVSEPANILTPLPKITILALG